MTPSTADLTYQLNAIITATRFRQGVAEEEIAAFVEGMLAARASRQPLATRPETPASKRKRKARK